MGDCDVFVIQYVHQFIVQVLSDSHFHGPNPGQYGGHFRGNMIQVSLPHGNAVEALEGAHLGERVAIVQVDVSHWQNLGCKEDLSDARQSA